MSQILTNIERALKYNYLNAFENQIGTEPSALLNKIKHVELVSDKIKTVAPIGFSGGFGYGAEGAPTPASGAMMYEPFETEARDMYVNIGISVKTVRLGSNNKGAIVNALDGEIKGAYKTANWNMGRSLFGNGSGVLTTCEAANNTKVIKVADVKNLKEGLIIDIYKATIDEEGKIVKGTEELAKEKLRILGVDRANSTITIFGDAITIEAGFITIQQSWNREITGLGTIFDNTVDTIYGLKKADNPFLAPVVMSADDDIRDGVITKALRQAKRDKNSNVDMIMAGDDAYDSYVEYLRTNNIRVEEMTHEIQGGFKSIKFLFDNRIVDIVNEAHVPSTEMWGVDTSALEFHKQKWDYATLQGGSIFTLLPGESIYRALLANYGDLICKNPGGCIRITDCSYARV